MIDDIYHNPTKFYFGHTSLESFCEEFLVDKYKRILLIYGKDSIKKIGLYEKIIFLLNNYFIKYIELGGIEANPKSELIYEGILVCKNKNIDLILAVGGGSVIDSAKAISIGAKYDGDFVDFFYKKNVPNNSIDIATILTIAGSGSESSPATVITFKDNLKLDYAHQFLFPKYSILNPEFTISVDLEYTFYGIADAFAHILERYISNTEFCDSTDGISEALMRNLIKYANLIQTDLNNYHYRSEILWSCKLAHDNICGFGKKQDWSSHMIANAIGGYHEKPHGAIVSVIMLSWLKFVSTKNEFKFNKLGVEVFNLQVKNNSIVIETIKLYEEFLKLMKIPVQLSHLGINLSSYEIESIVDICINKNPSKTIGNYVWLNENDIREIIISSI